MALTARDILRHANEVVRPVTDDNAVQKMWAALVEIPLPDQARMWMRSGTAGHVCVFRHPAYPGKALEYVAGTQEDSVTTLVEDSSAYADLGVLRELRTSLIREIGASIGTLPSALTVDDNGRGRSVALPEMGTAQLIDMLAQVNRIDLRAI